VEHYWAAARAYREAEVEGVVTGSGGSGGEGRIGHCGARAYRWRWGDVARSTRFRPRLTSGIPCGGGPARASASVLARASPKAAMTRRKNVLRDETVIRNFSGS
jgi:hypothetical protein